MYVWIITLNKWNITTVFTYFLYVTLILAFIKYSHRTKALKHKVTF